MTARKLSPEQVAAAAMVAEAKVRGPALTGPGGLLKLFTENVPETALNEKMAEHLGHEKNQAGPDRESANVRDGSRAKTVISDDAGEVGITLCAWVNFKPEPEAPARRSPGRSPITTVSRSRRRCEGGWSRWSASTGTERRLGAE
ncbi:transposase [Amycolatopsis speibonae]|uniref:Transposase n=1 Tax=Amycolatopsis speibonae TaxID=1450224 RepID=A0ABV7P3X8_9PSEU